MALSIHLVEELYYSKKGVTIDASNDIQEVASLSEKIIKPWGMSEKLGPVILDDGSEQGNQLMQMMQRGNM